MKQLNIFRFLLVCQIALTLFVLSACDDKTKDPDPVPIQGKYVIKAADLSFLPEIEEAGVLFHNLTGVEEEMLTTLKNAGLNTVRIRLWKDPSDTHSGFEEVKAFSQRVRTKGLRVWLTVHYSDWWADPGNQQIPEAWQSLDFNVLKDSLYNYTAMIVREINPDYIQIGNEINNGMMWPQGNLPYLNNFRTLLITGAKAVRDNSSKCSIMIHYAGIEGASAFFTKLQDLDYDIIGLSYYPLWHGKSLSLLETTMDSLGKQFNKRVLVAETSYPFTLGWNDWTNNVMGLNEQLIDGYPATPDGQKTFLKEIKRISTAADSSVGFAYWGGEWISFKGSQATNGSSWENQAFYDFDLKALPVIEAFGEK